MKIKNTYLLLVTILGLVSLALYTTYAMFTASLDIGGFVDLTASSLPTDTSVIEYERLTLSAGESKIIELNITNTTDSSLYYGVWYEMIEPTSINDNIVIAKLDTSASETIGELSSSSSTTVTLILENNTTDSVVINLGVGYSETSSLNLPTNRNIVTATGSEGIDMSEVVIPETADFDYTGAVQTYTVSTTGTYKLEVWGAQGGTYNSSYASGGAGGYSYGTVTLNEGDSLYVYVGKAGSYGTTTTYTTASGAGINGGAAAGYRGGTGGDASDIRLDINNDGSGTLYERIIVAGGGGGAYSYSSTYKAAGGVGGGTSGASGSYYSSTYSAWVGGGASQTAGGSAGTGSSTNYYGKAGSFGTGGASGYKYNSTSYYSNGAGGGGWYGGGSAGNYSSSSRTRAAGGGGGSGFVLTSSTASNVPSGYLITDTSYYLEDAATVAGSSSFTSPTGSSETGHTGNGYARISYISTVPSLDGLTTLTIAPGSSYDLLSDVTCVDNGDGCTLVKASITDTSTLAEGTYEVTYIVKDSNNVKYKYTRTIIINNNVVIDESGANSPNLVQGLVPITYSNNKWVKADSSNTNANYPWYNYDDKQWANAVLVSSSYRDSSNNDTFEVGEEVPEDAILAYYVWIPRYKYKVWNISKTIATDSYDAQTTGIDITFETGTETTGTISCKYDFSVTDGSLSETCTGSNGDYYTHPAFWWDVDGDEVRETNEELSGIWVSKFELSNYNSSTSSYVEGTTTYQIRIKPNEIIWSANYPTSYSAAIQAMATSGDYGLDSTTIDSHMIKNIEWGAIVYFAHSDYGRCANESCDSISSNSMYSSSYTWHAGCGPQSATSNDCGEVCNAYNTELGQLASTTGNIYGIYDLVGGTDEYVMGNSSSTSGSYAFYAYASDSGTAFTHSTATAKYMSAYAYGRTVDDQAAYNRSRLGDATGEVVEEEYYSWNGTTGAFAYSSYIVAPWFTRGNSAIYDTDLGIFYFNYATGDAISDSSTRAILIDLN